MTASALPRVRTVLFTALVVGSLGLLSGCAPEPGPTSSATPSPSASATATSTPTEGTPTEGAPPSEQPDLGEAAPECGEILSADDMYAYNPNVSAVAAPTPASGTLAAEALSLDGTLCRWSNDSSNAAIDVAVAVPGSSELDDLEAAASSDATPADSLSDAPSVTGYFDVEGDVGTAQVFANGRWIVLSSPMFGEAADVEPLATAIIANLGAAS